MEYEKIVRDKFSELFESNKKIESLFKKLKTGTADYREANEFSLIVGEILSDTFGEVFKEYGEKINVVDMADEVVSQMLRQNYKLSSLMCDVVQGNLNRAGGIGVKPIAPEFDVLRAEGIVEKIKEIGTVEGIKVTLSEDVINFSQSVADEWVRTNAEFQKSLGLGSKVVRIWSGSRPSHDSRGTDWCESLAGVYNYTDGEVPANVWKRHKGCKCIVSYYPNGSTKGSLTALAKGEKDTAGVLWNTGRFTSYSRDAILRRRREQFGRDEARKILNEEWKGGRNGQAERHF